MKAFASERAYAAHAWAAVGYHTLDRSAVAWVVDRHVRAALHDRQARMCAATRIARVSAAIGVAHAASRAIP